MLIFITVAKQQLRGIKPTQAHDLTRRSPSDDPGACASSWLHRGLATVNGTRKHRNNGNNGYNEKDVEINENEWKTFSGLRERLLLPVPLLLFPFPSRVSAIL